MALIGFPVAQQYFAFDGHPTELFLRAVPSQVTAVEGRAGRHRQPAGPLDSELRPTRSDVLKAEAWPPKAPSNGLLLGLGAVKLLVGGIRHP